MGPLSNKIDGLERREPQNDYGYQELLVSAIDLGRAPGGPPPTFFQRFIELPLILLQVGCILIGVSCQDFE